MKEVKPEVAAVPSVFPFIEYIPAWFPGARLKCSALISQRSTAQWVDAPFQYVTKNMAAGTARPSMLFDIITRIQQTSETEEDTAQIKKAAKEACASAYAAAAETTFSTLSTFILAMVLYPEVQKRAQAEIDSVIGSNLSRLPVWEDQSSLAYIDAIIIKETLSEMASCSTLGHSTRNRKR
ncbi:cytochrome P450 [Boletus edulis]|nr:cytochrome P450 [Boletus edulis]